MGIAGRIIHLFYDWCALLKSGKKIKYRQLPSITIIFITQDDIFKRGLAKYTFTEQCEEVKELKLEDRTTKIFLNMTSKNGSKEDTKVRIMTKHNLTEEKANEYIHQYWTEYVKKSL